MNLKRIQKHLGMIYSTKNFSQNNLSDFLARFASLGYSFYYKVELTFY